MLGNSAALEAGGVRGNHSHPAGGEIGRDAEKKLNGLLYDNAMNSVIAAIPRDGEAYIQELVNKLNLCIDDMLSKGLTGGHKKTCIILVTSRIPCLPFSEPLEKNIIFESIYYGIMLFLKT